MAEGRGGYRQPSNPAPVSGPGAMSRRTDGQGARYMAGGEYGEGQEMMDLQTSAPMSQASEGRAATPRARGGRQAAPEAARPTPLFAPTERPDEPITAGAPFGPGPGPAETLQMSKPVNNLEVVAKYLPVLQQVATYDGAPDRFRALVRYLQGSR
jgi:hypothetical protein